MQVHESFFRDMLRLFVWYPLRWMMLIMPLPWCMKLLNIMGDVHCALSRGKQSMLLGNLALLQETLPLNERASGIDCVRNYFRNHYVDHLLILVFPKFNLRETERYVEVDGLEHLDEALKRGKGVVLVHGHFGPVHLPLVVLAQRGYAMKQIGLPSDEGLSWIGRNVAFRLRMRYEAKIPAEIIKADGFLRSAFRCLQSNGVIMITGDGSGTEQRVGKHASFTFFGYPVLFPLGPSILAEKTGAAILPMFIVPGERKPYRIVIERPLTSRSTGEEKIQDLTGQFIARLEHHVSRFPGWMHFLDRFSVGKMIENPESEPSLATSRRDRATWTPDRCRPGEHHAP